MCLDGNLAAPKPISDGALFTHPCKRNSNYQLWRQVGNGTNGVIYRNIGPNENKNHQKVELCLDSNDAGAAYVNGCNGGTYQKWVLLNGPADNPQFKLLQNVQTKKCLKQGDENFLRPSIVGGVTCDTSDENQRWQPKTP
jgi:hypothetical protein